MRSGHYSRPNHSAGQDQSGRTPHTLQREMALSSEADPMRSHPYASVVVITRNRPLDLQLCLKAMLDQTYTDFELVVIDQSCDLTSAELVDRLSKQDARVHYVHDTGRGAARARNRGTNVSHGEIVVFTDDDCEPDPDWLAILLHAIDTDPAVGLAYGAVIPAPHDPNTGFIVGFRPIRRTRLHGKLSKLRDAGISASVAARRTALVAIGGFDEMLGPGSYFPCAEDFDLTYRLLSRGYALLHCPEARVVHHGLRDWRSGSGLVYGTYVAIGAAYMKHVRLGDGVGVLLMLHELLLAVGNILRHVAGRRGPFGFGRLRGLIVGALRSFELDVEPTCATYKL
jgi:GT2 family glycosyltransferase